MKNELAQTIANLKSGKIILYPTDTVWGLGCDATNNKAVSKIFQLKNRQESKSLVVLVSSLKMLKNYISNIPQNVINMIASFEKPTTIIYSNPKKLATNTIASNNTVAIRITRHTFCLKLLEEFGKPIVSTSANISGDPTPKSFSEITQSILYGVDYIVNLERKKITKKSSTILKIEGDKIKEIRA